MVAQSFNPSIWHVEAGKLCEFKVSLVYKASSRRARIVNTKKPCLRQKQKHNKKFPISR